MLYRLYRGIKSQISDVKGQRVCREIRQELGVQVESVRRVKVFVLEGLEEQAVQEIIEKAVLHDPVLHEVDLKPLQREFDWALEVGFKPGVTDNEARTAQQTLRSVLGLSPQAEQDVFTAVQYLLKGELSREQVEHIARNLLANELIERYTIKSISEWQLVPGFDAPAPRVSGKSTDKVQVISLSGLDDAQLKQLSADRVLALSLEELRTIRNYYNRQEVRAERENWGMAPEPTDAELEVLAQTWSEHCKHKIFNACIAYENREKGSKTYIESLYKTFIQSSTNVLRQRMGKDDFCLSVFKDNAGVIRFDSEHNLCIKVETHNSPSALDPYGGALTGIVGVNRDPMGTGLGANLICNTDVFCFASPYYDQPLPPRLLHPHRVLEGVREGVEHGGNQSGIPTLNGGLVFEERYLGKPLVFCGTGGFMPAQVAGRPSHEKKALPGDVIVMTGGRIGKDGIHGATFSSEELHSGSPATAVQIGDPITQRKMYDFIMWARNLGLYNAITDNGAGGLSSSVGEMAEDCGGCELDLSRAPLKYDGLTPWEILLSEAQERMTLAVPEEKLESFLNLAREMDVEATALGRFNDSGFFKVTYGSKLVALLDMHFLHAGLPQMQLNAVWEAPLKQERLEINKEQVGEQRNFLRRMLGRLNICSREYVIRQYDHEVQGGSVVKPLVGENAQGPGDAAVVRPLLDQERGIVLSNGICPRYSDLDTYWMMACSIDEAVRNNVAVGGNPGHMAGVDNFCWCDPVKSEKTPDGEYKLAQLVRANQALAHYCQAFGVPCISGKDSMKNDYTSAGIKISIPPTVLFSLVSVIPDIRKSLSSDWKQPGDWIYLLGLTRPELGASEFAAEIGLEGGLLPQVDALSARSRYYSFYQAVQNEVVNACHDLSDGGLAVAAAEMAIGGELNLRAVPTCPEDLEIEEILYSETPSRLLVTVPREKRDKFEEHFAGQKMALLGQVRAEPELSFYWDQELVFSDQVGKLTEAWKKTMDW